MRRTTARQAGRASQGDRIKAKSSESQGSATESDQIFLIAMGDSKVDEPLRAPIYDAVHLAGESVFRD